MNDDHLYNLLGVKAGVRENELRAAFVRRTKILHPDRFDPITQKTEWHIANEMLQELNEAYNTLKAQLEGRNSCADVSPPKSPSKDGHPFSPSDSAGGNEHLGSEQCPLQHGFWISDDGDYIYIPSIDEHAPLMALSKYFAHMVQNDPEATEWVQGNYSKYKSDPSEWKFWEVYATYLILSRWHLLWEGTIFTRWNPEEIARLIRSLNEVKRDLEWPDNVIVQYRHIETDPGEEVPFPWGYFSDPKNALPLDKQGK